jgi:hypothetical protein
LVAAVDLFVFFNDVNFIKRGWINRNLILNQNQPQAFSIPLVRASQNKKINVVEIFQYSVWKNSFLKGLEFNYRKSPFFNEVFEFLHEILDKEYLKIDELAAQSVRSVAKYIGLETRFMLSSDLSYKGNDGQEKILDICKKLNASSYVNPKDGSFQYDETDFNADQIDLFFIEPVITEYAQFGKNEFVPRLSVIDVLMFNSKEEILAMVRKHKLYKGHLPF